MTFLLGCGKQIANVRGGRLITYKVIRITSHNESATRRLVLEGKLAGACVDELYKCWQQASSTKAPLLIDLTSVSFIDDRGKQLLTKMYENGTKLVSTSLMTRCLIKEIDGAV